MRRVRALVDRAVENLLVLLVSLMVLNVLWQVFTRYVLRSPSSYTEELARFLLIWVGLLGGVYALRRGMHLAIEALVDSLAQHLGDRLRQLAARFAALCVALFAGAVMVVGGSNLVRLTYVLDQTSAALRLPLSWVYVALPLCGLLMLFYAATGLWERNDRSPSR